MLLYLVCLAFIIVAQRYGIYKNFHKKIPPDRISPKGWENYYAKVFAELFSKSDRNSYLLASSIATATATVIPTMGLLPAPMRPIISTSKAPKWRFRKRNPALHTSYIGDYAPIISYPLFTIQDFNEQFSYIFYFRSNAN